MSRSDEKIKKSAEMKRSFPHIVGQEAEIFFQGEWIRGRIIDGYRFRDGIVSIRTESGKIIWCGESRTELYRQVEK